MKHVLTVLLALTLATPAFDPCTAQITSTPAIAVSIGQPPYGFNILPGSTRHLYATVSNGKTNAVTWSLISGGGTLASTTAPGVDFTAPPRGTTCSFGGSSTAGYTVSSATQVLVKVTSNEDPSKSAIARVNVCEENVQIAVVPFYRVLYANQVEDLQSFIVGAADTGVTWSLTKEPNGGDARLPDVDREDAQFSATVPGRYTVTATSNEDPTRSASAVLFVTGHAMPYLVTPNGTEPVDPTVDPESAGPVYEVGPSQRYRSLAAVPFPTLPPGSTVRIHNEDITGLNPTTYHEYVQLQTQNNATHPLRVVGYPDALGHLPVIDAVNATGRSDTSPYAPSTGVFAVHSAQKSFVYPTFPGASYVSIEGLAFRNVLAGNPYTQPDGTSGTYSGYAAGVAFMEVENATFVGNEVYANSNGVFSEFNATNGYGNRTEHILYEGNFFHNNGWVGQPLAHQMYLQDWGSVVQFNKLDQYTAGASGSNLKSRGIQEVIRYNYFGPGAARQLDLVDVQDAPQFMSFEGYLNVGNDLSINYPADLIAAEQEAWNHHFVYGNVFSTTLSGGDVPIHFAYDHNSNELARKGTLWYYQNTFLGTTCTGCSGQKWTLFDTSAGGGNYTAQVEYPNVFSVNNIDWMGTPGQPDFQWQNYDAFNGTLLNDLLPSGVGTSYTGGAYSGFNADTHGTEYQGALPLSTHIFGFDQPLVTSTMPLDATTFAAIATLASTTAVPAPISQHPVRFSYLPAFGYAVPRVGTLNVGAIDPPSGAPAVVFGATVNSPAAPAAPVITTSTSTSNQPTITVQPAGQTAVVGSTSTFSVVAAGSPTLKYQWFYNGQLIAGATNASYTTGPLLANQSGDLLFVVVTNAQGSILSLNAGLTVTPAPAAPAAPTSPITLTYTSSSSTVVVNVSASKSAALLQLIATFLAN